MNGTKHLGMRLLIPVAALLCCLAGPGRAVTIEHNSSALEFTYEWPVEAAAISSLDRRLRSEATMAYRRHLKIGLEDKKLYAEQQRGSIRDFYLKRWTTAGKSPRLLSLQFQHSSYTGGAHPNTDYGALLWDLRLDRPIKVVDLFQHGGSLQSLTRGAFCKALDAERLRRRNGERPDLAEFNRCPKYADLAIAPVDKEPGRRFDALALVASPYTAGPYAEGDYAITLPITRRLIAAMKPAYRASFEPQRQ